MTDTTRALAVIGTTTMTIPPVGGDAEYAEEMEGMKLTFTRVKIPSGGGTAFEIPVAGEESIVSKDLVGVIVDHHASNSYFVGDYTGGNNPPQCASPDGRVGVGDPGGSCPSCPMNQWGSGKGGVGKACQNRHNVYILRNGEMFPLLLTLPPTSVKSLQEYLGKQVISQHKRSFEVLTRISLRKAVNQGGIAYSQAVFSMVGALEPDLAAQARAYNAGIKEVTRVIPMNPARQLPPANTYEQEPDEAD